MDSLHQVFGRRVRQYRKARELTQEELAELVGISLKHLGDIERGKANPRLDTIVSLSKSLDVPAALLLNFDDVDLDSLTKEQAQDIFNSLDQEKTRLASTFLEILSEL